MRVSQKCLRTVLIYGSLSLLAIGTSGRAFSQVIPINGADSGRSFAGIGAVSGGGATSLLLKDYSEPQRSQILDYLFKPDFGASLSALYVEIGGDGNSTQGTEPSHMHTRTDTNFQRGYEWWIISEAKKRNPDITLDGVAWGCPGWVGNGNFWSQDMCNYYAIWIKGLKTNYGFDMDAIGCKNEGGVDTSWVPMFRTTLDNDSFSQVRIHAFDNWEADKYDFASGFATDPALNDAVNIVSAHTTWKNTTTGGVLATPTVKNCGKPIWDTEEHASIDGFDGALNVVDACNENYIDNRITKILFWFLVGSVYPIEGGLGMDMLDANQPWSGYYSLRTGIWGYAHYGQFTKVGWQYLDGACGYFPGGGTHVALKSPDDSDFSIIIETMGVTASQTATFSISGGLPTNKTLCVWLSNSTAQFVRQSDIVPTNGSFTMTIAPSSIYSISTTTGQQKGTFATAIPASEPFPFPYYENYDHYTNPKAWGYLPHYQADICGVFEITERPDSTGKCLRQIVTTKASSWAPEWMPFSVIGDATWTNYDASVDVYFDDGGWASVMGRIPTTGGGYGSYPEGYYLRLASTGAWACYAAINTNTAGTLLSSGSVTLTAKQWNNLKLRFSGTTITGFINTVQVFSVTNTLYSAGAVGLGTGDLGNTRNSALFDNLIINTVGGATPPPTAFPQDSNPIYAAGPAAVIEKALPASFATSSPSMTFKIFGERFSLPREFAGKRMGFSVYDLKGRFLQKGIIKGDAPINLKKDCDGVNEVRLIRLKASQ
jgi:galactosylceramidase